MTDTVNDGRYYLTCAIDYVNGAPHLGHVYEKVGADMLARFWALNAREVRFTVGSDEHSQSVERAARTAGLEPAEFCRRQVEVFQAVFSAFDVEPTAYVRTSSEANRRSTERFLEMLHSAGHIYKGLYAAWFCPSCEQFYTDKQLVDGLCPVHERPVEWVEEENWFFRLSAFSEQLRELLERDPAWLTPESRRNEILNVVRGGLSDLSVSRGFSNWGFPLPFDASQVAYVWFDALLAYVTGIGFGDDDEREFSRFWPVDVHIIGKDITRFHALMWPAMLMGAGLPAPRHVHAHGFLSLGGRKLSKTSGVRIDPDRLLDALGSDGSRYALLTEVPFDRDADVEMEALVDRYNADLANDYGNLVSRTEKMVQRYCEGRVPLPGRREAVDDELRSVAARAVAEHRAALEHLDLSGALVAARRLVARANLLIEESKPWVLVRAQDDRLGTVLGELLEAIRVATILLHPVIPRATVRVARDLGQRLDADAGAASERWGVLRPGDPVAVGEILFPRLDREQVVATLLGAGDA